MTNPAGLELELKHLIDETYSSLPLRSSVLHSDLFKTPMWRIMLDPHGFMHDLKLLPNAGVNTVETLKYILDCEFKKLERSEKRDNSIKLTHDLSASMRKWLGEAEREHVTLSPVRGSFVTRNMDKNHKHPFWQLDKVHGGTIFHLPMTLPDIFKTPEIWRAESCGGTDESGYTTDLKHVVELAAKANITIRYVIDKDVWKALIKRTGIYENLTLSDAYNQISYMEQISHKDKGKVIFETAGFKASGLSNCLVLKNGFVSTFMLGGNYISKDPRLISHVYQSIITAKREPIFIDR